MSLVIVFKGADGLVLAADSRHVLKTGDACIDSLLPTTSRARKLLPISGQDFIGVLVLNRGVFGSTQPRHVHDLVSEFGADLASSDSGRLRVQEVAARLGAFLMQQWNAHPASERDMNTRFLVAGFDEGATYGRIFELCIPDSPTPAERLSGGFGFTSRGQNDVVKRLANGFDPGLVDYLRKELSLSNEQAADIEERLRRTFMLRLLAESLPLEDLVTLCVFLIETTIKVQSWFMRPQTVGEPIDVATITRADGFRFVRGKRVGASET